VPRALASRARADESVKEALAAELVPIVWWFATVSAPAPAPASPPTSTHPAQDCGLVADDEAADVNADVDAVVLPVPVHAFTPIIGTLLLSSAAVGAATRVAVVDLLRRVRDAHDALLALHERELLEREIVEQIVVGIGRLDMPDDDDPPPALVDAEAEAEHLEPEAARAGTMLQTQTHQLAPTRTQTPFGSPSMLPAPDADDVDADAASLAEGADEPAEHAAGADDDDVDAEQAAVGRLSSMSLMAAVSAGGASRCLCIPARSCALT
jgi:serine/threonine-protein phosphatase 4 regulatory subunit 1